MTEDELLSAVVEMAHWQRWLVYHIRNSKRGVTQGDEGFPDLIMARPPRLIVAECKSAIGRLTTAQERWLGAWRAIAENTVGVEVFVWRPEDWTSGRVEAVLR